MNKSFTLPADFLRKLQEMPPTRAITIEVDLDGSSQQFVIIRREFMLELTDGLGYEAVPSREEG